MKCSHPDCKSLAAHKLIFIPTRWGYESKFYCSAHKKYGRELSRELSKKLHEVQETIYGKWKPLVFHNVITGEVTKEPYSDSFINQYSVAEINIVTASKKKGTYTRPSFFARQKIIKRDGNKCLKCGTSDKLTVDHIIPVSRGGTNQEHNLQTLCEPCNLDKGTEIKSYRSKDIYPNDFPHFEPHISVQDCVHLSV